MARVSIDQEKQTPPPNSRRDLLKRMGAIAFGAFASPFIFTDRASAQGPENKSQTLTVYIVQPNDTFNAVAAAFGQNPKDLAKLNPNIAQRGLGNLLPHDIIVLPSGLAVGDSPAVMLAKPIEKPESAVAKIEKKTFGNPDSLPIEQPNQANHQDIYLESLMSYGQGRVNEHWYHINSSVFENGKFRVTLAVGAVKETVVQNTGGSLDNIGMDAYGPEKFDQLRVARQESNIFPAATAQGHDGRLKEDPNFNKGDAAKVISLQLNPRDPDTGYYIRIFNSSTEPNGKPVYPVMRAFLVQN